MPKSIVHIYSYIATDPRSGEANYIWRGCHEQYGVTFTIKNHYKKSTLVNTKTKNQKTSQRYIVPSIIHNSLLRLRLYIFS
jgi:hypothetical protein